VDPLVLSAVSGVVGILTAFLTSRSTARKAAHDERVRYEQTLQGTISALQAQIAGLDYELRNVRNALEMTRKELQGARDELAHARLEITNLEHQIIELVAENRELRGARRTRGAP
jgi:chromosome segregation ATPase